MSLMFCFLLSDVPMFYVALGRLGTLTELHAISTPAAWGLLVVGTLPMIFAQQIRGLQIAEAIVVVI